MGRAALKLLSRGVNRRDIVTLTQDVLDLTEGPVDALGLASVQPADEGVAPIGVSLRDQVAQLERRLVQQALQASQGRWADAARRLGIDASNLHKLAKRLGVK